MRNQIAVVTLLLLGTLGCTADNDETPLEIIQEFPDGKAPQATPPQYYSARLAGVLAGPGKVDDTPWDGTGMLAQSLVELAASITGYPILESKAVINLAQ